MRQISELHDDLRELASHTIGIQVATPSGRREGSSVAEAGVILSKFSFPNRLMLGQWPTHGLFLKKPMQRNTLTTK